MGIHPHPLPPLKAMSGEQFVDYLKARIWTSVNLLKLPPERRKTVARELYAHYERQNYGPGLSWSELGAWDASSVHA